MNPRTTRRRRDLRRASYPHWFLIPAATIFTAFYIAPAVLGFIIALTNASATDLGSMHWVGLDNFKALLGTFGGTFFNSVGTQIKFAVGTTIVKTGVGTALAFFLNRRFKGRAIVRTLVYLPIMFSTIVVGLLFYFMLDTAGLYGSLLNHLGLGSLAHSSLLTNPTTALPTLVLIDMWVGVGWTVIIVLAAIQGIPRDVLESAELDGARGFTLMVRIKLPFIIHAITLAMLLTFIAGMKAFDIIYVTTGSGPANSTDVMTIFILRFLQQDNLGFASAAGAMQFILIVILAYGVNKLSVLMSRGSAT